MPDPPSHDPTAERASNDARDFQELRDLLVAPERQEISRLRERLENPQVRAEDVSRVVAEAIHLRRRQDPGGAITQALTPTVEEALRESVRKDPRVLADALFPVMGPAIRRSITEAIRAMMESFNRTLERSVSVQGLKWRIESIRTGKPFAEVVMLHSLLYRVEQVFLIHRETSLVLRHVVAPEVSSQDPALVSAMLSAIQDFVRDSFRAPPGEILDRLEIGDLQVWIEEGPQACLAAVISGHPPAAYRQKLRETLEKVHRDFAADLAGFRGEAAPFAAAGDDLAGCLASHGKEEGPRRSRPYFLFLLLLPLLAALAFWAVGARRERRQWDDFLRELRQQPGMVVTSFEEQGDGYRLRGLRDPLASDPGRLLANLGLDPARVQFDWAPYYALDDAIVAQRAATLLQPPPGVALSVREGVLVVRGEAPAEWLHTLPARAKLVAGVREVSFAGSAEADRAEIERQRDALASMRLLFPVGGARLPAGERVTLGLATESIRALLASARRAGVAATIDIVGRSDSTGSPSANLALSRRRAAWVREELIRGGVEARFLRAQASGASEPVEGTSAAEHRSVIFRVTILAPPGAR